MPTIRFDLNEEYKEKLEQAAELIVRRVVNLK